VTARYSEREPHAPPPPDSDTSAGGTYLKLCGVDEVAGSGEVVGGRPLGGAQEPKATHRKTVEGFEMTTTTTIATTTTTTCVSLAAGASNPSYEVEDRWITLGHRESRGRGIERRRWRR
jgi:hypothetical protein